MPGVQRDMFSTYPDVEELNWRRAKNEPLDIGGKTIIRDTLTGDA